MPMLIVVDELSAMKFDDEVKDKKIEMIFCIESSKTVDAYYFEELCGTSR